MMESLAEKVRKIQAGEWSAEAVLNEVYDRIEQANPELRAYRVLVSRERLLEQARDIDARVARGETVGRLAGAPISIKDCICIQDPELDITCGSKLLEGYHSPYSATAVERLQAEDALIVGLTNMDEFAMGGSTESSAYGISRNPWDAERVPGGSSGGAAASVAAGLAWAALGSDTGGSVRQPASFCGVTGFKPTYGTTSRYGLVAYGSSLDQIGVLAPSAEDCQLVYAVVSGHDPRDSTSVQAEFTQEPVDLSQLRFCLPTQYLNEDAIAPEVIAAVKETEATLLKHGATVEHRHLDFLDTIIPVYYTIAFAEASSNLGRFDGIRYGARKQHGDSLRSVYTSTREEGFGPEVKRRIMLGTFVLSSGYYDQYYGRATQVRNHIASQAQQLFEEFDFILGPVSPTPAFRFGEKMEDPLAMYLVDLCSVLANLTKAPAISLPGKPTAAGLPVGVQLIGPRLSDARMLATTAALQQHLSYYHQRPF